jgi:hypothetical protein
VSATLKQPEVTSANVPGPEAVSQLSRELVIGLVGYVGAGCSTAAGRIELLLDDAGYTVHRLKMSELIRAAAVVDGATPVSPGLKQGLESFARGEALQNAVTRFASGTVITPSRLSRSARSLSGVAPRSLASRNSPSCSTRSSTQTR